MCTLQISTRDRSRECSARDSGELCHVYRSNGAVFCDCGELSSFCIVTGKKGWQACLFLKNALIVVLLPMLDHIVLVAIFCYKA